MSRRLLTIALLASIASSSYAQGTPRWLRELPVKIYRGATVSDLRQIENKGRIEIEAEIPVAANALLAARLRAPRIDDPKEWMVMVVKDDRFVSAFGIQEVQTLPNSRTFDRVRLRGIVPPEFSTSEYRFYFSVQGRDLENDTDTRIVFGDAALVATHTPRMITSYSVRPAYTNIEGSRQRQWVLEFPIRISFPRPFGAGGAHPIRASLLAVPSTQSRDTNAGFVATLNQELTDVNKDSTLLPYIRREWGIRYRSNAQLTNRVAGAFYSVEVPLTSRPVDSGIGYRTQAPALLKLGLLSVEYRERIDRGATPHHTATFLTNPWAMITLPPLYIGGGDRPSPFRHPHLVVSARGWAFPFEQARGGFGVRRFESRFDAELTLPMGGPFGQAFILGYHTGANENDNYFRQSTLSLEFQIFGRKASLYRTRE